MINLYSHPNESRWYITSDPHFDHPDILKHNPLTRSFKSIDEMHDRIIFDWNLTVRKNDFVIIVGDFAYKNVIKWAKILHGKKYLICGHHDSLSQEAKKHFLKVCEGLQKTIFGRKFYFNHYPCITWPDKYDGCYMIHGHSHGRLEESPFERRCDVSMDAWGLKVVPIEVIFEKLDEKIPGPAPNIEEKKLKELKALKLIEENIERLSRYSQIR